MSESNIAHNSNHQQNSEVTSRGMVHPGIHINTTMAGSWRDDQAVMQLHNSLYCTVSNKNSG